MVPSKKNLIGSYTIPKQLERELQKENEVDDSVGSGAIEESIKNEYNKQSYKVTDGLRSDLSYRERMKGLTEDRGRIGDVEEDKKGGSIEEKKEERKRPKRWDVTPEERTLRLEKERKEREVKQEKEVSKQDKEVGKEKRDDYYTPIDGTKSIGIESQLIKAPEVVGVEFFKKEDEKYFGVLTEFQRREHLSTEEQNEVKVLELLLKIKNGTTIARKRSLRSITDGAKSLGSNTLFKYILPLLVEPSLEDSERHVLVKLIGRIVFKLDDQVKPHTHKILMAVSPLLIDEDFNLRVEAREIISGLSKVAGLVSVITAMRPDLSNPDEYVRNIASRILAVVANTLGLVQFLPFLKAVIKSKQNWQTKHTGIKIIQQLCIQLGAGNGTSILPYLKQLVELLVPSLSDETLQIRSISATALAQLADTVNPYGIELFEPALEPIWVGIKRHRGRALATFLKCLGSIIPLMSHDKNYEEYSNYYTRDVISVLSREFNSQDDEMKSTILKVLQKLPLTKQLLKTYEKDIYTPLLRYFWNRRTASDTRFLYKLVVSATTEMALKLNFLLMIEKLIIYTKDDNESLRAMAVDTIGRIISAKPEELIGSDTKLEERLVDGVLYGFQEQKSQEPKNSRIYLNGLSVVCKALGMRLRPHLNSILSTILYQIKNKAPEVRQQAGLLLAAIAPVVKLCTEGETETIQKLILILYESLGEEFPDVLSALLTALDSCLASFSSEDLLGLDNPSIPQLLPSLSPILKNRQEKVQEACIKVIGLIAKKTPEIINSREWMRICFDLLDTLKSPKKRIRIAANTTFGDIARTIGPQDVLTMLLNNLRVQQRQLRVCTAVAIGIVADVCQPFTIIPAIMNEYRTPDNNVQNGILKAMTFLFEYIDGNKIKDYLYAITTLLQDALTDRDQVHRQTAATVVKHLALNCEGCINNHQIDVFIHFMNLILPNIFETSPHVINRIIEALDSLKNVVGYGRYMNFVWAGLFHPAKKVRASYWKLFNGAYIQSADAIVPFYPTLEGDLELGLEEFDLFI